MIRLINGKGQLGEALSQEIEKINILEDLTIYHTWNHLDKTEPTQKKCFEDFLDFLENNKDKKIIFISTYSQTDNYYNHYKQLAEAHLLSNHKNGFIIRLPTLIGKGTCKNFRDNPDSKTFGEMELMSIEDAAKSVLDFALSDSKIKSIRIKGNKVQAKLAKRLIEFGRDGI